ncbi:MAG: alcohol dehydrogenase catalytic domain-containing protein [Ignavibacteria bacterium]|nr:alcohol dehydrogenase catalytic domain-containing protein [Ignavibacteria bacterium]
MNALVLTETGLHYQELPAPVCGVDQVRIKLHAAALNHRDQYIREGKYSKIVLPAVLGFRWCGHGDRSPSHPELLGKRVVIDPSFGWGDDPQAQGPTYSILGMPTQGTFAEEVVVPAENVHRAPEHLTDEQAAALPLAGVTGYRALMVQGALQSGESVLVTGIGGGVASMIMMFALAAVRGCMSRAGVRRRSHGLWRWGLGPSTLPSAGQAPLGVTAPLGPSTPLGVTAPLGPSAPLRVTGWILWLTLLAAIR